jgi:hypothetical protein
LVFSFDVLVGRLACRTWRAVLYLNFWGDLRQASLPTKTSNENTKKDVEILKS